MATCPARRNAGTRRRTCMTTRRPYPFATIASVEINKPRHPNLLGSQTIIATRNEYDKPAIAQILKLLTYLRLHVLVARIELAEVPLESIDLFEREFAFTERLHAFHDIEQPTARFRRFVPEEKRLLPFREDEFFRANDAALNDLYFSQLGNAAEQNS